MYKDAFYKIDSSEAKAVLSEAANSFDNASFNPDKTTLLGYDLSFYPGYRLIDLADYGHSPPLRRCIVHSPGQTEVLDWTSGPVYALNKKVPLVLNAGNVADYVRFFFQTVRGRYGHFQIIESVSDIPWSNEPPASARKAVGRMIQPVQVIGREGDGAYTVFVCMAYRNSLFRVNIKVAGDGMVTMAEEELLVDDMPVRDDIFGQ